MLEVVATTTNKNIKNKIGWIANNATETTNHAMHPNITIIMLQPSFNQDHLMTLPKAKELKKKR